jgi:glycosyltransferase involved in cell wall biosynthesis
MKVTVVTPVYNGMPWLPGCICSIAQQRSDVDIEHLVYDGGSTDGSAEWLREHTSLGYEAIIGPDDGQTDALAKGFARGTGDIFAWLNADDLLEPGALKRVVEVFAADPGLAMVTGACLVINSRGAITGAIPAPRLATLPGLLRLPDFPPQPATFFSAHAYRSGAGLDRQYDLAMDLDLWLKLVKVGPVKTLPTEVLARFRSHPTAKTAASNGASAREALRIRRRHGMPLGSPAGIALIRAGYVRPVVSPWTRAFRRVLKRLILGREKAPTGDQVGGPAPD